MSVQIVSQEEQRRQGQAVQTGPPPLESGDRLSRAEFERRYQAHPEIKKAELVDGVVYVSLSVRYRQHAQPHACLVSWLGSYAAATPGVEISDSGTVLLDFENEVQPDAFLRLKTECGGSSAITEDDYIEGPPELIGEVAASSAAYDLYDKKRVYARDGVPEYLVMQMYEKRVDWFVLREGVYESLEPDEKGIFHSEIFPGLWLQPEALWSDNPVEMLAVLQEGLASPEHVRFVEQLKEKLGSEAPERKEA
jgi:Uma2 family endonuclease